VGQINFKAIIYQMMSSICLEVTYQEHMVVFSFFYLSNINISCLLSHMIVC